MNKVSFSQQTILTTTLNPCIGIRYKRALRMRYGRNTTSISRKLLASIVVKHFTQASFSTWTSTSRHEP